MVLLKSHAVYKHTSDAGNSNSEHALIWRSLKYHYTSFHLLRKIPTKTITVFLKGLKKCIGQNRVQENKQDSELYVKKNCTRLYIKL